MSLVPAPGVVGTELDGESYLHLPGSPDVVLLDEVASHVWALLGEGCGLEEVVGLVAEAYRQPGDAVRKDVDALVRRLTAAGLLVDA